MIFGKRPFVFFLLVATSARQVAAVNRNQENENKAKSLLQNMLPKLSTKEILVPAARHLEKPPKNIECFTDTADIMSPFMDDVSSIITGSPAFLSQMLGCISGTECNLDYSVLGADALQTICEDLGGHYFPVDVIADDCETGDNMPFTEFKWLSQPFCVATSCTEGDAWFLFKKIKEQEPFSLCDTKFEIVEENNCADSTGKGPGGKTCSKHVALKAKKFCKKKKYQAFCPETCGLCSP